VSYDQLIPYDDECLFYEGSHYSGNILSVELGDENWLKYWREAIMSELKTFSGSIKCGNDIKGLMIWLDFFDNYYVPDLWFEGDTIFSNPIVSEGSNLIEL